MQSINSTDRAEMIGQLVEHSVSKAKSEANAYWMRDIFEKGFAGYSKFSDQQLRVEMQLRGLETSADAFEDEDEDDFSFSLTDRAAAF